MGEEEGDEKAWEEKAGKTSPSDPWTQVSDPWQNYQKSSHSESGGVNGPSPTWEDFEKFRKWWHVHSGVESAETQSAPPSLDASQGGDSSTKRNAPNGGQCRTSGGNAGGRRAHPTYHEQGDRSDVLLTILPHLLAVMIMEKVRRVEGRRTGGRGRTREFLVLTHQMIQGIVVMRMMERLEPVK